MFYNLSFDFYIENSDLHGLIPCSNNFTSKFLQKRVCPPSLTELITKEKNCFFVWTFVTLSVAHFFV